MDDDGIIRTVADAERVGLVGQYLAFVLQDDPRVQLAYARWRLNPGQPADLLLALDALVRDQLHLEYRWLSPLMAAMFVASVVQERTGTPLQLSLTPSEEMRQMLADPGRRPKDDGRHLLRDVQWYYRAEIKHPKDSVRQIAREYAGTAARRDARSVVQNGIKRVKRLLAALDDARAT